MKKIKAATMTVDRTSANAANSSHDRSFDLTLDQIEKTYAGLNPIQ
jgi:hypothetical protein